MPEIKETYENSRWTMASYGSRELFGQWIAAAFGFSVFFFYEAVIGLESGTAALAFILYSIWNAVNDPLTGYLMERVHFPWEKKWGIRRFPFLVIGGILWLVTYLLIFLVPLHWNPAQDKWLIFAWYVGSLCLYDTVGTLYDVNVISLYPDKFRGLNERRTVQGFGTILGILGLVLAAVIPPMFIKTGVAATYRSSALVTLVLGLFMFLLIIPGIWENKRVREQYKARREMLKGLKAEPFFKTARQAVTDRLFMMKVIFFYGYQISTVMIQTSAFYVVTFLLNEPAKTITILLGSMLVGALVSVPLWTIVSHRVNNNKKVSLVAGVAMFFSFIPLIFVRDVTGWAVCMLFFGVTVGGQWFMDPPTMGDVLDDLAVRTGRREQGIYYGYQAFFIRLGQVTIALTISVTHMLTGYVEGVTSQADLISKSPTPELALFGIRIHSAIVPAIIVLICILLFWKWYDLTPEKVAENKRKLKELGL